MTQLEAARQGIVTEEMEIVAAEEHLDVETVRARVAEGTVVIPANVLHKSLHPWGIESSRPMSCTNRSIPGASAGGSARR